MADEPRPTLVYPILDLSDTSPANVHKRSHALVHLAAYTAQTYRSASPVIRIEGTHDDLDAVIAAAEDEYRTAERADHRDPKSTMRHRQLIHDLDSIARGVALVAGAAAAIAAYSASAELGMNVARHIDQTS